MDENSFEFREINPLTDLGFEVACHTLYISEDTRKLIAAGVYKPTVKLFDFKIGIMKFERHLSTDPIKLIGLEEDAEKFAILKNDKTVEFHTKGGLHEKVRMPTQPKDMILNKTTAEIYFGGKYDEIYRFNLEQGRFLKNISCKGGQRMSLSDAHGLLGVVNGKELTFIDTRCKEVVFSRSLDDEILSISQDETGLKYALGADNGCVYEYDFRSKVPQKRIEFESFIKKIQYSGKNLVIASGKRIDFVDGDFKNVSCIQPGFFINDYAINNGLVFVGGENSSIKTYVSENIGPIPSWIDY